MLVKEKMIYNIGGIVVTLILAYMIILPILRSQRINEGKYANAYIYKIEGRYITYRFQINGRQYICHDDFKRSAREDFWLYDFQLKDSVLIKYDTKDPNNSRIVVDSLESVKRDLERIEENKKMMIKERPSNWEE
ncbi:MAG: hypothetical protein Q8M29_15465 [Bacteroidota bacterium]|nr:hypothetical protein [Bacteroidota bacterium]